MTASELTARVTTTTALVALPLAVAAGWAGGGAAVVGVLAGAALALASFRGLAARAVAGTPGVLWVVAAGVRFALVAGAAAALFVLGWAHPVAVLAGYTVLPVIVVVQGLRLARESASWT